jgi:gas vesicle protein
VTNLSVKNKIAREKREKTNVCNSQKIQTSSPEKRLHKWEMYDERCHSFLSDFHNDQRGRKQDYVQMDKEAPKPVGHKVKDAHNNQERRCDDSDKLKKLWDPAWGGAGQRMNCVAVHDLLRGGDLGCVPETKAVTDATALARKTCMHAVFELEIQ